MVEGCFKRGRRVAGGRAAEQALNRERDRETEREREREKEKER